MLQCLLDELRFRRKKRDQKNLDGKRKELSEIALGNKAHDMLDKVFCKCSAGEPDADKSMPEEAATLAGTGVSEKSGTDATG